ncbi:MAG: urea transporter [Nitrospira sp.]|nr:urea transporter [Nitrospira sp.]
MAPGSIMNDRQTLGDPAHASRIVLRGFGQVMLQGHAGTGLLFLIGIAVASPLMAVGAGIGAIIGPLVASLAQFDRAEIEDGIHGFNPVLVGIATFFYLKPEPLTWGLLVVGCVGSTFLTFAMRRFVPFPTYTAPFVLATWILLLLAHAMVGTTIDVQPVPTEYMSVGLVDEILRGVAEVMFGANMVTGMFFLAGIALCNWRHAVLALLGSVLGLFVAMYHHDPVEAITLGLYGYNASLAAIAGFLWRKSLFVSILAILISVPLTEFFPSWLGIPPLTAPFVAAAWLVIVLGQIEVLFLGEPGEEPS